MWLTVNDRYQEKLRQLNLVKTHAHEIVGVKREQVHRVIENLSRPGTYDITVHRDGRVEHHEWTAPEFQDAFVLAPAIVDLPEGAEGAEESETVEPVGDSETLDDPEVVPELVPEVVLEGDGGSVGEAEVAPAPTPSPEAPKRRGRPKKVVS